MIKWYTGRLYVVLCRPRDESGVVPVGYDSGAGLEKQIPSIVVTFQPCYTNPNKVT